MRFSGPVAASYLASHLYISNLKYLAASNTSMRNGNRDAGYILWRLQQLTKNAVAAAVVATVLRRLILVQSVCFLLGLWRLNL